MKNANLLFFLILISSCEGIFDFFENSPRHEIPKIKIDIPIENIGVLKLTQEITSTNESKLYFSINDIENELNDSINLIIFVFDSNQKTFESLNFSKKVSLRSSALNDSIFLTQTLKNPLSEENFEVRILSTFLSRKPADKFENIYFGRIDIYNQSRINISNMIDSITDNTIKNGLIETKQVVGYIDYQGNTRYWIEKNDYINEIHGVLNLSNIDTIFFGVAKDADNIEYGKVEFSNIDSIKKIHKIIDDYSIILNKVLRIVQESNDTLITHLL